MIFSSFIAVYFPSPMTFKKNRTCRFFSQIASVRVILGLVGMTLGCATLVILVCCSLKCYWDRVAHNKRLNEKRVEMVVRRAMNSKMDKQVVRMQAHNQCLKKKPQVRPEKGVSSMKSDLTKMTHYFCFPGFYTNTLRLFVFVQADIGEKWY